MLILFRFIKFFRIKKPHRNIENRALNYVFYVPMWFNFLTDEYFILFETVSLFKFKDKHILVEFSYSQFELKAYLHLV